MTHVLEGISGKFAMAYLADIIIFSPTVEKHLEHLSSLFARLKKLGLKVKMAGVKLWKEQLNI